MHRKVVNVPKSVDYSKFENFGKNGNFHIFLISSEKPSDCSWKMGEQNFIEATQSTLGKVIQRPSLSEKNLSRPPFRFLHDIVTQLIKKTGFFKVRGLLDFEISGFSFRLLKT